MTFVLVANNTELVFAFIILQYFHAGMLLSICLTLQSALYFCSQDIQVTVTTFNGYSSLAHFAYILDTTLSRRKVLESIQHATR